MTAYCDWNTNPHADSKREKSHSKYTSG